MAFVHGHARDTGWVVAHLRRPNRAEEGQIPLVLALPKPRDPPPGERHGHPRLDDDRADRS
jgi:hypothetical protein